MFPRYLDSSRLLNNRLLQHIAFWIVVVCYFVIGYTRNGNYEIELYRSFAFLPNHLFIVYTFFYFLIPKFLFQKKFILFFLFSVLVYAAGMQLSGFINFYVLGNTSLRWSIGASMLGESTVLGIAISIKLLKYWYKQKQQIMVAEQQKISAELELLKSQIHPHFLFNTLNNLYAHTLEQSDKAPRIVLKLSNLLRFMIYESNAPFIPLKKDIALLQEYIELEQLRYGNRLDVSMNVQGSLDQVEIAPLLLLPLVENAFKYGTSKQLDQCWISLDLHVSEGLMKLKLINSRDKDAVKGESGGIGLQNVSKRLELLYPGMYSFHVSEDDEVFVVMLDLQLSFKSVKTETISIQTQILPANGTEMFTG
jgi:sensor histidine kinase YesM